MASANGILPTIQQNLNVQIASPNGSTALLGTSSAAVIGSNASRRGLIFVNPSAVTIFVCPANQTAVIGQGVPILPSAQVQFIGDGKLINYNSGWNGIAASGSNNPLTVLELL
jgi:hypothetical protein